VCCSIGDDLTQALLRVLSSAPPFDAVVVEASGVSDPWRVAQFALADSRLRLDGVIVLLDTACALEQARDPLLKESIERPLAHADLVVLNKSDLVDAATLDNLRAWVGQHAPRVPVIPAVQADLPVALLGSAGLYRAHGGGLKSLPAMHATQFETWHTQASGLYDEVLLRTWLENLPPGVLRLKGWLHSSDASWLELQFAGARASLRHATAPPDGAQVLVAIGLAGQLPVHLLQEGLARCGAIKT
jgi:G3E family GTPase